MEKLSRDVMIDILSRLPIKSVLRCKSVSKSWEALLSDPLFAAAHFNSASTLAPFSNYIVIDETNKKLLDFIDIDEEDGETSTISKHLNFPFLSDCLTGFVSPLLMGSCRGYVCLSATDATMKWGGGPCPNNPVYLFKCFSSRDATMKWGGVPCPNNPMYLFNPITGDNILLPQFKEQRCYSCAYGFGLDVSTQECKVLLVYFREKTFSVQVHTVGRDYSWRTNTVPTLFTDVTRAELANGDIQTSIPLGFNGSIHWIVLSPVDKKDRFGLKRTCILSFQLDTEVFGVIPMPEPLQLINPYFYDSMMYALQLCGGCLSIIYSPEASFVDIWVMDDYKVPESWVKKYSIQVNFLRGSELMPFGFRKNGELMLCLEKKELVSYNTDNGGYKILRSCWTVPFPFVGSLISLKSAYGDSEVVGTSGFGNPFQPHLWTIRFENGVYNVHEISRD